MNEWKSDEIRLLHSMQSNEEISEITGRTVTAVKKKRYEMTGHYVEFDKRRKPCALTQNEKEARLYALAQSLGVKIGG